MLSHDSEMSCQCFRLTEPGRKSEITAAKSSEKVTKLLFPEEVFITLQVFIAGIYGK